IDSMKLPPVDVKDRQTISAPVGPAGDVRF
ncbi:unnamed protein product, partial [marine sediment metagenome]